jgi:hypothetical protein
MSAPINDGGPAFPRSATDHCHSQEGMTLRDYFAAAAMKVILEDPRTRIPHAYVALNAYYMADAMLKAREAK